MRNQKNQFETIYPQEFGAGEQVRLYPPDKGLQFKNIPHAKKYNSIIRYVFGTTNIVSYFSFQ